MGLMQFLKDIVGIPEPPPEPPEMPKVGDEFLLILENPFEQVYRSKIVEVRGRWVAYIVYVPEYKKWSAARTTTNWDRAYMAYEKTEPLGELKNEP